MKKLKIELTGILFVVLTLTTLITLAINFQNN
jgi:hypothetical protein